MGKPGCGLATAETKRSDGSAPTGLLDLRRGKAIALPRLLLIAVVALPSACAGRIANQAPFSAPLIPNRPDKQARRWQSGAFLGRAESLDRRQLRTNAADGIDVFGSAQTDRVLDAEGLDPGNVPNSPVAWLSECGISVKEC